MRDKKGRFIKGTHSTTEFKKGHSIGVKTRFKQGDKVWLGKKRSEETKEKIRQKLLGRISPKRIGEDVYCLKCSKQFHAKPYELKNGKGKYCSRECAYGSRRRKHNSPHTEFKKGKIFKGTQNEYWALHKRIRRKFGKAIICKNCGSTHKIEWSNISHEYKEDISDWQQLCRKCHYEYDRR